jgi:hypothetical protein
MLNYQFAFIPFFLSRPLLPTLVPLFSVEVVIPFDHTERNNTVGRTPLDEGSARRRDLYLTTTHNTHKRQTSIRTHDPSKRAAEDPRLRPHGH